ncbi:hypothetical protein Lal_00034333 [Lupinus albus]|uniref:Dirigent protein n=1 Tax=Lupinus albus TaxID=3870 RepID=A0A6A5PHR2_LUPAL|nr:putative allene oxide cyclase/dirigent protein [Lupinus albus]KAF1896634.1 hypothetical protein Lal_00034333 [Lupinus albus]
MAPSFMYFTTFLLIMSIMGTQSNGEEVYKPNQSQTTLVFYLHDVTTGPNATVAPVIGLSGKVWSYTTFGTIFVVDDPVHLSPSISSTQVGRAQGILTASAIDGSNVNVVLSVVFNNLQYSGSTIEIQGVSRQRENYRELSIVSGTGKFRYARGFASFETSFYDAATTHSVIRLTLNMIL